MSFQTFINQLSATNVTLDSLVDFDKVCDNTEKVRIQLNQLNYLIGKENLEEAVKRLYEENKNCFSAMKVLLAVRKNIKVISSNRQICAIDDYFTGVDKIIEYINATGLNKIFKDKSITNLVDYVFGIEVGLDSNARKNRNGKIMERLIASLLRDHEIPFEQEVSSNTFPELRVLGKDKKRFDFVITIKDKNYLIEVNYYNGGGSKLNETARSYSEISPKINALKNFEFVWITDGQGWLEAKNKLQEAYNIIPKLYNLASIDDFIKIIQQELK